MFGRLPFPLIALNHKGTHGSCFHQSKCSSGASDTSFCPQLLHLSQLEKAPNWSPCFFLTRLQGYMFEPIATCDIRAISFKVTFQVTATSAHWAMTIAFFWTSSDHITFFPKLVSRFHWGQDIFFPTSYPTLVSFHSVSVIRALDFYT